MSQVARFALAVARGHDPYRLPALAVVEDLSRLCGNYRTYRGTMRARVIRQGDFLKLLIENRSNPEEVILVPEELEGEETRFFTLSEGRRLPVSFRQRGHLIELLYERYKFRRDGPLR